MATRTGRILLGLGACLTTLPVTLPGCAGPAHRATRSKQVRLGDLPLPLASECPDIDLARIEPTDVVIAIDVSASTRDPSGADINRNGEVGEMTYGGMGKTFDPGSTDPGDSLLAAQVSATRFVVHRLAGADVRFAVLTSWAERRGGRNRSRSMVASGLTRDLEELDAGVERVLASESHGLNDFYAGMDAANGLLEGSKRRRVVLFLSDSWDPARALEDEKIDGYMASLTDATRKAVDAGNAYHTYALGTDYAIGKRMGAGPDPLEKIADATGGRYRALPDLNRLPCQLLEPLRP